MKPDKPWRPSVLVWKTKHSTDYLRCDSREEWINNLAHIFECNRQEGCYTKTRHDTSAEMIRILGMLEEEFLSLPKIAQHAILASKGYAGCDTNKIRKRYEAENAEIDRILEATTSNDPLKKAQIVLDRSDYEYERVTREYFLNIKE